MKKSEAPAQSKQPPLSLWKRAKDRLSRTSIRTRVFAYFLLFVVVLLVMLWLFQIVLLDDFYRHLKTEMLSGSAETLTRNIDNPELQALSDRLSEQNDVCVLIVDEKIEPLVSSDATPVCIIHRFSRRDITRYIDKLTEESPTYFHTFELTGMKDNAYEPKNFQGRVPSPNGFKSASLFSITRVARADGQIVYLLLNAQITPVDATVQTLRDQLVYITLILIVLSFLISLVLSRRITRPIVETNEAAKALSLARFDPPKESVSYREILELNETLKSAAKELGRVEEMQRELIANISHDLRTPLTLIEGYAEVMRDLPGENTPENMQVIIDETKRLSTLVNAVLDYTTAKSGKVELTLTRFDLTQSVLDTLTRYQKLIEQDGFTVEFRYDCHVTVEADEVKVGQVIYNLINNALTYTGEDKRVVVEQKVDGSKVKLSVIDTGEGIAKEELEHIWSRYYRSQKPHKRAAIGTGLGLSIVESILEKHKLEYGVNSEIGQGTEFYFVMPVVEIAKGEGDE